MGINNHANPQDHVYADAEFDLKPTSFARRSTANETETARADPRLSFEYR